MDGLDKQSLIRNHINESIEANKKLLSKINKIEEAAQVISKALIEGNKVLVCGNGSGSLESEHFTCELLKRSGSNLQALNLCGNNAVINYLSDEFGYSEVYSKQIAAYGKPNDVLLVICSTGELRSVNYAIEAAQALDLKIIVINSNKCGNIADKADVAITVPCNNLDLIEENQKVVIHSICNIVERVFTE